MKKGEITAFLSMVFVLLVSFVLGILEISVIQTSKSMSRITADRALFSLFGGYQAELFEDYHVFAFDGSFGSGEFSRDQLNGRLHRYGDTKIQHEITGIQFLTDENGQAFREQVLEYMETKYGISLIRRFTGMTEQWEEEIIQGEEMQNEESEIMEQIEEIREPGTGELPEGNPFGCLEQIESSGILSLVLPSEMQLSGLRINAGQQASSRNLSSGFGTLPQRQGMGGIEERLLFNEYVLGTFGNAVSSGADENSSEAPVRTLQYETEYILGGKDSDKGNLEAVLLKIFFIRMAMNYIYLYGDSAKRAETMALATVIATALLIPEAVEVIEQLIVIAWAAGESVADLRSLLSGKKAAFVKNADTWQLSLSSLLTLGGSVDHADGEDAEGGISYEDYLRIFLFAANPDEITMRTLDRIEENLSSEHGMTFIRADQCVTKMELKNTTQAGGGIQYTFPAYFGYQ